MALLLATMLVGGSAGGRDALQVICLLGGAGSHFMRAGQILRYLRSLDLTSPDIVCVIRSAHPNALHLAKLRSWGYKVDWVNSGFVYMAVMRRFIEEP